MQACTCKLAGLANFASLVIGGHWRHSCDRSARVSIAGSWLMRGRRLHNRCVQVSCRFVWWQSSLSRSTRFAARIFFFLLTCACWLRSWKGIMITQHRTSGSPCCARLGRLMLGLVVATYLSSTQRFFASTTLTSVFHVALGFCLQSFMLSSLVRLGGHCHFI